MKTSSRGGDERPDRREWMAAGIRYTMLGSLALLSGHLAVKSQRDECRQNVACRSCGQWKSCRLPRAIQSRRELRG